MLVEVNPPVVSVCMITYNHEQYLAHAIEGVISQRTAFSVHLLIAEDHSTDKTRQVALDYAARYPEFITVLDRPANLGMMPNFIDALNYCNGRYIALCEGDDYWDNDNKLQKQVDFLEANPDYAICFHNLRMVLADGKQLTGLVQPAGQAETTTIYDLAKGNFISTLSCVFRNAISLPKQSLKLPAWYAKVPIGDYCLHMLNARHGKIKYLPDVMGVYRMHGAGAWSMQNQVVRSSKLFDTLHFLKHEFEGPVRQLLDEQQLHNLSTVADESSRLVGFDLDEFLQNRKQAVEELISDNYILFMKKYFVNENAARSAEYRLSKRILYPVRWAIEKIRQLPI